MYARFGHPAPEPSGCADVGATEGMDTTGGAPEACRWSPQEEEDQEFFENGEHLPSAIDTTQHCYNVAVSWDYCRTRLDTGAPRLSLLSRQARKAAGAMG